jgi:hypothetical protein
MVPLLALPGIACVQRVEPFYEVRITAVVLPPLEGQFGMAHGTVTNLADFPMDFGIHLSGVSLEPQPPMGWAKNVLPGQTAVWRAAFVHRGYTPRIGTVEYTRVWPKLVYGHAVITGVVPADARTLQSFAFPYGGPYSEVMGTVTNTGTELSGYVVDLQAENGEISVGYVHGVGPGQTGPWDDAVFRGNPKVRVVRISNPYSGLMIP